MSEAPSKSNRPFPVIFIKTGTMKRSEIKRAEKYGFVCIVESDSPEMVRFLDVPLQVASLDAQSRAAMELMRHVTGGNWAFKNRSDLVQFFVDALLRHDKPQPVVPATAVQKVKH